MSETAKSEKTHILWCTNMDDDGYADILFLTGDGPFGVGINCGGHVIVKPLRDWHALASVPAQQAADPAFIRVGWFNPYNDYHGFQQVHRSYEGGKGTFPLFCRASDLEKTELPTQALPSTELCPHCGKVGKHDGACGVW